MVMRPSHMDLLLSASHCTECLTSPDLIVTNPVAGVTATALSERKQKLRINSLATVSKLKDTRTVWLAHGPELGLSRCPASPELPVSRFKVYQPIQVTS